MDEPVETYRKLNQDLIQQVQEYKKKQRLYEMSSLQMTQESLILKRVIRDQKALIESFVSQNSQDLTVFLGKLAEENGNNMTVVTEFVQKMLIKFENLLLNISTDESRSVFQRPEKPQLVKRQKEAPVVKEQGEEEPTVTPSMEVFITKRRRRENIPARNFTPLDDDEDVEADEGETQTEAEPTPPTECVPTTLPDGMLSTIPEAIHDSRGDVSAASVENETDDDAPVEEQQQQPDECPEADDKENEMHSGKFSIAMDMDQVPTSTPNPRKRGFNSRTALSPVDMNPVRVKRCRTPMPEKRAEKPPAEEVTHSARPRRRAAPQSMVEPSLREKMRQ